MRSCDDTCKVPSSPSLCTSAGVIEVLTEALKDKNERVRRRIMATLGELLFYVATQQQVLPCTNSL